MQTDEFICHLEIYRDDLQQLQRAIEEETIDKQRTRSEFLRLAKRMTKFAEAL